MNTHRGFVMAFPSDPTQADFAINPHSGDRRAIHMLWVQELLSDVSDILRNR